MQLAQWVALWRHKLTAVLNLPLILAQFLLKGSLPLCLKQTVHRNREWETSGYACRGCGFPSDSQSSCSSPERHHGVFLVGHMQEVPGLNNQLA
jgi:hypothetical protein